MAGALTLTKLLRFGADPQAIIVWMSRTEKKLMGFAPQKLSFICRALTILVSQIIEERNASD
ncbi:hypothetical protein [Rhizobium ruizarguesonis]|uniref:hypothetical protein n=1 Tax=Rhizobium TaxID=379 RepID=UPI0013C0A172|nr:hypothetical protein [Rhizobium ruizarguesonis]MBY5828583.1 hypothetical protein [Rhizobium leguminosarum]MBY5856320.1 hypothetical protein [Rhizobium leguminosarum]NEI96540.1 hypothetical protein [Rhizobium ruizarguesonis]NEJ33837.1 hypothetical protein [Rhizobium ruizarguesonis]